MKYTKKPAYTLKSITTDPVSRIIFKTKLSKICDNFGCKDSDKRSHIRDGINEFDYMKNLEQPFQANYDPWNIIDVIVADIIDTRYDGEIPAKDCSKRKKILNDSLIRHEKKAAANKRKNNKTKGE